MYLFVIYRFYLGFLGDVVGDAWFSRRWFMRIDNSVYVGVSYGFLCYDSREYEGF